jgi:hypothetical protein
VKKINRQTNAMKTLHSIIAGLRPAYSIIARRVTFPLLLLGAGLLLIQPCLGQSGTWMTTGSLITGHGGQNSATLLPNGKVLVASGCGCTDAELYDPASGTWTATGSLITVRYDNTATFAQWDGARRRW